MAPKNRFCDIIIPVWNNPDITKECVDSILKNTAYPFRIILIDNASAEPARTYIDSLRKSENIKVIRNDDNRGFVKAVNQGMSASTGDYVCVLNNDTIATPGWLNEMINILENDVSIGIVNPSSNTFNQYPGTMNVDQYADSLGLLKGRYQELSRARGFAMVIKREVLDRIGQLDEIYGMGYYDDTDYGMRAQKAGYKVVMARASYVFHRESRSFKQVKDKARIFMDNEAKFESRWGKSLKLGFVITPFVDSKEKEKLESFITDKARLGDQTWIFADKSTLAKMRFIDHENIRVFGIGAFLFVPSVLFKLWKRRKKKKIDIVITNSDTVFKILSRVRKYLRTDVTKF